MKGKVYTELSLSLSLSLQQHRVYKTNKVNKLKTFMDYSLQTSSTAQISSTIWQVRCPEESL